MNIAIKRGTNFNSKYGKKLTDTENQVKILLRLLLKK